MGGVAGGLGKLAMGLGKLAGPLAAVAVVMGAFVGIATAAYGKVKAWNKAILEGASAFDIMGASSTSLENDLGNMRQAMSRVSRSYSMTAEEAYGYVAALNEAGITVRELKGWTDATSSVTAYSRAMSFGIKYTKALGISSSELGTLQQQMMEGFGMRMNALDDSMQSFGKAAQMAGMNSRSFVAAIMEGTANMALYNFRLEDTMDLMVGLANILGEDLAKSMLQMEGTFKNMSTQDRYKASMTGGGVMEDVLQGGARRVIEGRATAISLDHDLSKAFRDAGLMDFANEFDIDKLASLKGAELGAVQNSIAAAVEEATGSRAAGQGAVRSLEDLTMQARILSGGATTGEKADAMAAMDRPTEIAASVARGLSLTGAQDFGDLTGVARMQFEELTGIMGEEFESTKEIFNRAQATLSTREGRDVNLAETLAVLSENPEAILDPQDLEKLRETPAGDPMMEVAKQTLMATQTVGDLIGGQISGALNWNGGGVSNMVDYLAQEYDVYVGNDNDARAAIAEAEEQEAAITDELAEMTAEFRKTMQDDGVSPEDKKAAEDAFNEERARLEKKKTGYENMRGDIEGGILNADDARTNFLKEVYGGAEIMTEVRERVTSGNAGEVEDALTYSGMIGQKNTSGRVNYYANSVERTFHDDYTFTDADRKDEDGNVISQGAYALESVMADPEAMMEVMANAEKREEKANEDREEEARIAEDLQKKQLKEAKETEKGIKNILKELRKGDLGSQALSLEEALVNSEYSGAREYGHELATKGFDGDFSGLRDALRGGNGYTREELALLRLLGISTQGLTVDPAAKDFVYQGNGMGGVITPIDDQDSFFGAKPGGAIDRAGGFGGRSITIASLTINESGNPQKTLQMVKRALRAAEQA